MSIHAGLSSFDANRPYESLLCFWGSNSCRILPGYQCNRECSARVITRRFSGRLSVLTPFMWWTISSGDNARPSTFSTTSRCSFIAFLLILTNRYPCTFRRCFTNLSDMACRASGWFLQKMRRASAILWRVSGDLGFPLMCTPLSRRSIPNLIMRFLTVLLCTPNSLAIEASDRFSYSHASQIGSFNLSITQLYHNGNRLSL